MGKSRKRKAQEAPPAAPAPKKQHKELEPALTAATATASKIEPAPFVEEPRGAELKREVELYEQLSSQDETERLEAADAVVSGLLGRNGVSEVVLTRHLERRLFRGLASGRKAARLGFSVVLTEVLSQLFGKRGLVKTKYTGLGFEKVMEMLKAKTKPEGDLSGQEERDHAFGLLFGLQCFVRAKILFVQEEEHWDKVFDSLIQLAKKKPWMREECGWSIVEALEQMHQQQAEITLKKLQEAGLAASPEGVGIWLKARDLFPDMKFPSKPWGNNGNPLEHLSILAKVLKESSNAADKENGGSAPQTGNWHAQLHFAWDIVLHECIASTAAGLHDSSAAHFADFWQVAVDGRRSTSIPLCEIPSLIVSRESLLVLSLRGEEILGLPYLSKGSQRRLAPPLDANGPLQSKFHALSHQPYLPRRSLSSSSRR
jgi:DNA polymerase phi